MEIYKLDFTTFYNQFYISSDNCEKLLSEPFWSDDAYNNRLGVHENAIVIYSESYGHIKGELIIRDNIDYELALNEYDHIVEGSLNVDSGLVQFLSCPSSVVELEVPVSPGSYRIRVCFINMAGYDSDEEESDDYYLIEIWPSNIIESKVVKRYPRLLI